MRDVAGNEINKGSLVGFATRKGSNAWLIVGEVEDDNVSVYPGNPNRKGVAVRTKSGRVVYKEPHAVLVYG